MPKGWDAGTISAEFEFSQATTAAGGVTWGIQATAHGDGDSLNVSWGTAQTVNKTAGTGLVLYKTAETSAVTIGNTPASKDLIVIRIYRNPADGSDTLAQDAKLISVTLHYTTNAANDA
jgi:hypothetical protein